MSIEDSDDNTKTIAKTLWSETLIDVLMVALEKNASDDKVKDILKELKQKQFKASYITDKVRRERNPSDAHRVKQLMTQI